MLLMTGDDHGDCGFGAGDDDDDNDDDDDDDDTWLVSQLGSNTPHDHHTQTHNIFL